MKRLTILVLTILCIVSTAMATTAAVSGITRYASSKETIPYCTISLTYSDSARTVIKKFPSSDVGYFKVDVNTDTTAQYCLIFEAIGLDRYEHCFKVKKNNADIKLGNVDLIESSTELTEVSVVAQKPLVKMDLDRLTYDTESDPETKTSNALDMLRKVPLVTVDGTDKIEIKGSTNFKIYINGRPSAMVSRNPEDVFRSLPASTIKRIEVITDPGAKYEAEGLAGILNIVTYQSLIGYNGSVRAGGSTMGNANVGGYITTKIGKFGLSANLNYGTYNQPGSQSSSIRENLLETANTRYTTSEGVLNSRNHNFHGSIELSYEFDSLNLLSISGGGWYGMSRSKQDYEQFFLDNDSAVISQYTQQGISSNSYSGFNVNADYQHTFKKEDQNLTASYRYSGSPSTSKSNLDIVPIINYTGLNQRSESLSNGSEHTFQVDYTEPWVNKMHTLEVGVKYILRINSSKNINEIFDTISNDWMLNPLIGDNNLHQVQHVVGAYTSYSLRYKWFSLRAGGRLEHTTQNVDVRDSVLRPQYTNVVPSISLSFKLAQTQNLSVSYTQRLSRPSIWYINPYWDNSNPLNIVQGNPDLDVERAHNVSISYGLFTPKFNFNISAWGSITENSITDVQTILPGSDSITYTTYKNIGREMNAGGSIYINWSLGKIARLNINAWGSYNYYDARNVSSIGRASSGWYAGVHSGLTFFIPWKLRLMLHGGYRSPYTGLQSRSSHYYYYGLNLQRSFLKDRLTVAISASQFAEPWITRTSSTTTNFFYTSNTTRSRSMDFNISVSYSFGQMREQIRKVSHSISNDDMKSK